MNIYQMLGVLNDLKIPKGVISISNRAPDGFLIHMEPVPFMASFPNHTTSSFDSEFNECVFKGENVNVLCLVRIARKD